MFAMTTPNSGSNNRAPQSVIIVRLQTQNKPSPLLGQWRVLRYEGHKWVFVSPPQWQTSEWAERWEWKPQFWFFEWLRFIFFFFFFPAHLGPPFPKCKNGYLPSASGGHSGLLCKHFSASLLDPFYLRQPCQQHHMVGAHMASVMSKRKRPVITL